MAFGRHQKPGRGFVFSGSNKGQPDYASDAEAASEIKRLLGTPVGGGGGGGGNTPTLELTDGTHDITGVAKITTPVADLVVGGTSPNATLDLANTTVTPATYGDSTHVGQFVVDAKGRITGATSIAISFPASPVGANPTTQVDGSVHNGVATTFMRSDAAPKLADTAVSPATYGDSAHWATFTVDQQGRLTAASSVAAPAVPVGANPTATAGPAAVNGSASTFMRSDGAPAVQLGTNAQKGLVQVDGTTITASSGVISTPGGANPSATSSDVAVNGSAATFMRSDGAPAIQKTSASQFGLCKPDNITIVAASGILSATGPSLPVGFQTNAWAVGWAAGSAPTSNLSIPANGGSVLVPIQVFAPTSLQSLTLRNNDTTLLRTAEWRLYVDVGSATANEIPNANGTFSFTATVASNQTSNAQSPPISLAPGLYWLVFRNTSATNAFTMGAATVSSVPGASWSATKTLGSGLTSTLDLVTSWSKSTSVLPGTFLNGRVLGQSSGGW